MRVGSVCSGIESASVAWAPLGWTSQWFAEVDPFASAVLAHRFPNVSNHGDMTRIPDDAAGIDLLVGGTPCQSFSRAGLRGGMADDRGQLALEYCRLAERFRPRWVVWENVPDALSIDEGRAFGSILGALVDIGYRCAWRVLDAQYIRVDGYPRAVPQRRKRLFLVGHLGGSGLHSAAVLVERDSLRGHSPPRREAGAQVAGALTASLGRRCGVPDGGDTQGQLIPTVAGTLLNNGKAAGSATTQDAVAGLLLPMPFSPAVAFHARQDSFGEFPASPPLDTNGFTVGIRVGRGVRRLMPVECERLQGFPDGWTQVPYRGKSACDGPRYRAIGNSMAVNCMRWIGKRIMMVEAITNGQKLPAMDPRGESLG